MPVPAKILVGAAALAVGAAAVVNQIRSATEEEELRQEASKRHEAMEKAMLAAEERRAKLEEEEAKQHRKGGQSSAAKRSQGDAILDGALRLCDHLLAKSMEQLAERYRAQQQRQHSQDLLRIPILGAPEPVEVVLLSALLLWGDFTDYRRLFDNPRVRHSLRRMAGEDDAEEESGLFKFDVVHRYAKKRVVSLLLDRVSLISTGFCSSICDS